MQMQVLLLRIPINWIPPQELLKRPPSKMNMAMTGNKSFIRTSIESGIEKQKNNL